MSTSFETHHDPVRRAAPEAGDHDATAAARPVAPERSPFPVLPEGWAVIGRCRFGTGGPGPQATGCHALAHPDVGVALIDIAPNATPNAEARLRRALTAAEFWPDFPGTLPVMHDRVDGTALRSLPWVLEQGFAALPALTVPGGAAWIEGVQRAMAADSAWELPGQPKAMPDAPLLPGDDAGAAATPPPRPARPRRWGRLAAFPVAFAATFAVGLVSGFLLSESPTPVTATPVVAALPQSPAESLATPGPTAVAASAQSSAASPPAPPQAVASPQAAPRTAEATTAGATAPAMPNTSAGAPVQTTGTAPPPPAPIAVAVAPTPPPAVPATAPQAAPLAAEAPSPAPAPAPVETPAVQQAAVSAGVGRSAASSPLEMRLSLAQPAEQAALPAAPPRAPAPPIRVSSAPPPRPAPVIDRACSQALFRFQQGERLTSAEQNFLRTGCSTARR